MNRSICILATILAVIGTFSNLAQELSDQTPMPAVLSEPINQLPPPADKETKERKAPSVFINPEGFQPNGPSDLVRLLAADGIVPSQEFKPAARGDSIIVDLLIQRETPMEQIKQLIDGLHRLDLSKINLSQSSEGRKLSRSVARVTSLGDTPFEQVQRIVTFLSEQNHVKLDVNLQARENADALKLDSADAAATPEQIKMIHLQNTRARTVIELVKELFHTSRMTASVDERTNAIVFKGPPELLDEIEAIVLRLDEPQKETTQQEQIRSPRLQVPSLNTLQSDYKVAANSDLQYSASGLSTPTPAATSELKKRYEDAERQAADKAQQLRELLKGSGQESQTAKSELRTAVAEAFAARQQLHQAELLEFQNRALQIQTTISHRNSIQDQIIDRRVEDLLNPGLQWDASSSEESGKVRSNKPQSPSRRIVPGKGNAAAAETPGDATQAPSKGEIASSDTPLSDVVRAFNEKYADHPLGKNQPPLTDDEVVAAISWPNLSDTRPPNSFASIAQTRRVPPGMQLEVSTNVDLPDNTKVLKWSISITEHRPDGETVDAQLVREQFIKWQVSSATTRIGEPAKYIPTDGDSRPLAAAIQGFNARHQSSGIGKAQPALTEDEVIAAIRHWKTQRNDADVTNAEFDAFQAIADTRILPANAEFEVLTSFQPNDSLIFDAWSVRIKMPKSSKPGWTYAFTIRDRWIRSRRIDDQISWGPAAANGLQAGVSFSPRNQQYTVGQEIHPRFFYRNVGKREHTVAFPRIMTHGYYDAVRVVDDAGRDIPIDQDPGPGGPVGWIETSLGPDTQYDIGGLPIAIGEVLRHAQVETVIRAKPGQSCRVRFNLPNYANAEPKSVPLQTGEIEFTVASN